MINVIASERRVYIMNCLNNKGIVNLKDIAKELQISEITVRRDFEKLENAGKLKRVQGGAALEGALDDAELTMRQKLSLNASAKEKVAALAAEYVKDGDCVFLDGGTSVALLIDLLASRRIKIVTYNQLIVRKLIQPIAEIIVVGGRFMPHYSMNVGPLAQEMLRQFHFNVAFLGCSGIALDDSVAYTTEMESMVMKHIAIENAESSVLMLDASKVQKRAFLQFAELNAFDHIICDTFTSDLPIPDNMILVNA